MARIRSIKPEFFTSESVSQLPIRARLTWIGIWTECDDYGVTRNNVKLIKAAVWPLDQVSLADVEADLEALETAGRIVRYTVGGRGYLTVTSWEEHQKMNRRGGRKYPPPSEADPPRNDGDGDASSAAAVPPQCASTTIVVQEQGTGSREQGTATRGDVVAASASPPSAQTLLGEWIDHCGQPPPSRVKGHVARELKTMLDDGIEPDRIRAGLAEWNSKGLSPATLASVVHGVGNAKRTNNRQAEVDGVYERAMQRASSGESL